MAALLSARQHLCLEPSRKLTTRANALNALREVVATAAKITGSRLHARQCLEKAQGDSARMQDLIATVIEEDHMVCHPAEQESVCVVCGEDEGCRGPSLFDCGHAVCFECTTNMLLATYRDANFAMPCPHHPLEGCEGRVAVLPEHEVDNRALLHRDPDAPEEWGQYVRRLDDANLRAAGMFPCPSAFCSTSERVIFVPTAVGHTSCDTKCECCGLAICPQCTHLAGRPVPSHLPLPCSRQVDLGNVASNLQAALAQEEREARDREHAWQLEEHARRRDRREERRLFRLGGDFSSAWSMEPREFPEIYAKILYMLPADGRISYADIFRAAQTVVTTKKARANEAKPASFPLLCHWETTLTRRERTS